MAILLIPKQAKRVRRKPAVRKPVKYIDAGYQRTEAGFILTLPIKLISEANQREHWAAKHKRKKEQQHGVNVEWKRFVKQLIHLPCKIRFTRIGPRSLDSDNLAGSCKHVQDAVSKLIGIDDGSGLIYWAYTQEVVGELRYGLRIEVSKMKEAA